MVLSSHNQVNGGFIALNCKADLIVGRALALESRPGDCYTHTDNPKH